MPKDFRQSQIVFRVLLKPSKREYVSVGVGCYTPSAMPLSQCGNHQNKLRRRNCLSLLVQKEGSWIRTVKQSGPVFSEILLKNSNQRARQESMYVNLCLGFIRSEVELPEFGIWTLLFFLLDPVGFVYVSKGRYLALEQVGCRTVDSAFSDISLTPWQSC